MYVQTKEKEANLFIHAQLEDSTDDNDDDDDDDDDDSTNIKLISMCFN